MKPRIKFGLIVGAVGLVLNICVSTAIGICGPILTLASGALAGFLAARAEKPLTRAEGGRIGAIAGAVAGALIIIGQMLGGIGALVLMQTTGSSTMFGAPPPPTADLATQAIYYLSGLGVGFCFGLVGLLLGSLAGGGVGYLSTSEDKGANS